MVISINIFYFYKILYIKTIICFVKHLKNNNAKIYKKSYHTKIYK